MRSSKTDIEEFNKQMENVDKTIQAEIDEIKVLWMLKSRDQRERWYWNKFAEALKIIFKWEYAGDDK